MKRFSRLLAIETLEQKRLKAADLANSAAHAAEFVEAADDTTSCDSLTNSLRASHLEASQPTSLSATSGEVEDESDSDESDDNETDDTDDEETDDSDEEETDDTDEEETDDTDEEETDDTDEEETDDSDEEETDDSDEEETDDSDEEETDDSDEEETDDSDEEETDDSDEEETDDSDDNETDESDDSETDDSDEEETDDSDDTELSASAALAPIETKGGTETKFERGSTDVVSGAQHLSAPDYSVSGSGSSTSTNSIRSLAIKAPTVSSSENDSPDPNLVDAIYASAANPHISEEQLALLQCDSKEQTEVWADAVFECIESVPLSWSL